MKFQLKQISSNRLKTTFHVVNDKNQTVGSITVANAEVPDLQKHWQGARTNAEAPAAKAPAPRLPKLSKQAILRGS